MVPTTRIQAATARVPGSHHALQVLERDRRSGGGLLAGALAFRLFAVMLPAALLIAVGLGYAATVDRTATADAGGAVGIGEAALDSIAQASKLSAGTRWVVALSATIALVIAATGAAKAVHAAHSLAWDGAVERLKRPPLAGLVFLAALAGLGAVWGVSNGLRAEIGSGGVVVVVAAVVPYAAIWLGVSLLLPHRDVHWTGLVPGALLVGLGLEVVHAGTVLFVADRVEHASATYGPLGTAFTILLWLFIISRLMVMSAMLNAVLSERRPA